MHVVRQFYFPVRSKAGVRSPSLTGGNIWRNSWSSALFTTRVPRAAPKGASPLLHIPRSYTRVRAYNEKADLQQCAARGRKVQ